LLLTSCSGGQTSASTMGAVSQARRTDPLLGQRFYVDPANPARRQVARLRSEGNAHGAAAVARIAVQPTGNWFTDARDVEAKARSLTSRATRAGRSVLLVAYYIPGRDCGSFSSGGAGSGAGYRRWVARLAGGIGRRRATVILEPDAIAQALSGCPAAGASEQRYALLRRAVALLKAHPRVSVYIDAGNPGWIQPASRLAAPLRSAGVARADGFALNVANFYGTTETLEYGTALSKMLGGSHFVIDTGRNGNGPLGQARSPLDWCNPRGRALGPAPGTATGSPLADAYLWVKPPGTSDGSCRPGEPPAGSWWPQYALELAGG
jgi:endoglucanase